MTSGAPSEENLSADERAAVRAFLQRCEVRLSTIHRIAVGLLSGAGLLVVLPVVARDAVSGILRSLLLGSFEAGDALMTAAVVAVLAVPGMTLWFLFADLTRFYFHANHLRLADSELFTPRFTLTSLRLPVDELGAPASVALDAVRADATIVELLVPTNDRSRIRIDAQLARYRGVVATDGGAPGGDVARAEGLFTLAAGRARPLLEEVGKVEYGMTRHVLRLRGLVLRYVKAVLAMLTTAIAVYAGDAVVAGAHPTDGVSPTGRVWLAGIVLAWAPLVVVAVTSPVRWIEELMRDDGAPTSAVVGDPELTFVERAALRIAAAGWACAAGAMILAATDAALPGRARVAGLVVLGVATASIAAAAATGRMRNLLTLG